MLNQRQDKIKICFCHIFSHFTLPPSDVYRHISTNTHEIKQKCSKGVTTLENNLSSLTDNAFCYLIFRHTLPSTHTSLIYRLSVSELLIHSVSLCLPTRRLSFPATLIARQKQKKRIAGIRTDIGGWWQDWSPMVRWCGYTM